MFFRGKNEVCSILRIQETGVHPVVVSETEGTVPPAECQEPRFPNISFSTCTCFRFGAYDIAKAGE